MTHDPRAGHSDIEYTISYGKQHVPFQRVYVQPLTGIPAIPESAFVGRQGVLFAVEVDMEVLGEDFLPAYTVGDNSLIVATDSMKNIIIKQALSYDGATLEGYLDSLGTAFLARYDHVHDVRLDARELPFTQSTVPGQDGAFVASDRLLDNHGGGGHTIAHLRVARQVNGGISVVEHESGIVDLRLLKVTGSSFTAFVHDEHTTLPDRRDRPLFIYLDIFWTYIDTRDNTGTDPSSYVAGEQIADICRSVFHSFVSESIQHLVHEIGTVVLARFPQLAAVRFVAQNRTRDPWYQSETDARVKVYSEPFPAWGEITLRMARRGSGE